MILELADITVKAGTQSDYEAGLRKALPYLTQTEGYVSHELRHGIEEPTRYLLLIMWESVEAHMVNFRDSERYQAYRAFVNEYIEAAAVSHFELIDTN
jgi:heme-degrading monooxygenase HmoA